MNKLLQLETVINTKPVNSTKQKSVKPSVKSVESDKIRKELEYLTRATWTHSQFAAYFMQQTKTRALINGKIEYITRKILANGKLDNLIIQVEGLNFKILSDIIIELKN